MKLNWLAKAINEAIKKNELGYYQIGDTLFLLRDHKNGSYDILDYEPMIFNGVN